MRLFLPDVSPDAPSATVQGDKARYLSAVLRCASGDRITVITGNGILRKAVVTAVSRQSVLLTLGESSGAAATESSLGIALFQSLLKGEKMDLVVQKAVELGVTEIVPVITERSQVRETRKLARWTKIAEEASRQSGRSVVPTVQNPLGFAESLALFSERREPGVIFWEGGGEPAGAVFRKIGRPQGISVFTGPEGGYTAEEIRAASARGMFTASLGARILRAETASLVAVSLAQYELGDLSAEAPA